MTQLREPWFLNGVHSFGTRAIRTSVALIAAGYATGLVWWLVSFPFLAGGRNSQQIRVQIAVTAGLSLGLCVVFRRSRWCDELPHVAYARQMGLLLLSFVLALASQPVEPIIAPWLPAAEFGVRERMNVGCTLCVVWLSWCLIHFEATRRWLIMSAWSLWSVPLILLFAASLEFRVRIVAGLIAPSAGVELALLIIGLACLPAEFFSLLVVPWGLPLWFPPQRDSVEDEREGLVALAVALDPHASAGGTGPT